VSALSAIGPARLADLPERLEALRALVKIGRERDGFDDGLLDESESVLRRGSERLRLSAAHTVVAIAGGTGSGKSTLFNALAGASFSPPGVTRPTTREVHACVWGMEGAAPLLDWLGVPRRHQYARASALDAGESSLRGLVLLDLPDHDSVVATSAAAVDRVSQLADMLIWVLDPQKYADAAVHNRYLVPLAGHAGVFTVVLSQTDMLTPEQADDCAEDLRRLLDSEGLEGTRLYSVSGRTGEGLGRVRGLLAEAVSASRASSERISADIDSLLGRYAAYDAGRAIPETLPQDEVAAQADDSPYPFAALETGAAGSAGSAGSAGVGPVGAPAGADADMAPAPPKPPAKPPWEMTEEELGALRAARNRPPWEDAAPASGAGLREMHPAELARNVPEAPATGLTAAFDDASGLSAVADGLASAREAQASRLTGWPVARVLRRQPESAGSRYGATAGGEGAAPAAGLAPQSEVDNAITTFADAVGSWLPGPWPESVRRAARSRADEVPPALSAAVRSEVLQPVPGWWRLIAAWQWLLVVLAAAALVWAVVISVSHGDLSLIPWLVVLAGAMLLLGWLTSVGCRNMAILAAERERTLAEQDMRAAVAAVARDLVLAPAGQELAVYERFRRELTIARGNPARDTHPA
jgi:energy-coupling factor transporter ATP-binding protein EcfA2